jgi:hypothetical protein
MRNYPSFPRATPHQKAGSPRVPHPSATRTAEAATFDLHALGTPPALILSQDQTLHQVCPWWSPPPATVARCARGGLVCCHCSCAARTPVQEDSPTGATPRGTAASAGAPPAQLLHLRQARSKAHRSPTSQGALKAQTLGQKEPPRIRGGYRTHSAAQKRLS